MEVSCQPDTRTTEPPLRTSIRGKQSVLLAQLHFTQHQVIPWLTDNTYYWRRLESTLVSPLTCGPPIATTISLLVRGFTDRPVDCSLSLPSPNLPVRRRPMSRPAKTRRDIESLRMR